MILKHALKRAPEDSFGIRRAFGMKEGSPNFWRAITFRVFQPGIAWVEIQIRSQLDAIWTPMLRMTEAELHYMDPEIEWWPS